MIESLLDAKFLSMILIKQRGREIPYLFTQVRRLSETLTSLPVLAQPMQLVQCLHSPFYSSKFAEITDNSSPLSTRS